MADCFVGIDLGTSGCRAIAIDRTGREIAGARIGLPASRHPTPEASEQDADAWWRAVEAVLPDLMAQRPGRVRAIAVDGTSATLLLCDAHGAPCTPALMYDDRRARRQAERIAAVAPTDSAARGAGSALAKLLYLIDGPAAAGAVYAVHQADWIAGRLRGQLGTSDENNALKLGYDAVARCWPDWIGSLAGASRWLPEVVAVGTPLGAVEAGVAQHLGLPDDTLVVAGTTDSNAAALAAGLRDSGDAVTSLGSTLVLKVLSDAPVYCAEFGVYSHRIAGRWLVGGASNAGGRVLRRYFGDDEVARLSRRIDPRHPLGLDYYPLPAVGERFPYNDPDLAPRLEPRPPDDAHFLQAIFEGLAEIEATGYARLAALGAPVPHRVFSSGGGAVNPAWRAIRARRLDLPVAVATHAEAAYGAALLARDALHG